MLTIIIGLFIALVASVIYTKYEEGKYADFENYLLNSIIPLFLAGIISTIVAFVLPIDTKEEVDEFEIVSLQDNSSTEGSFFLGCGNINGSMKYVFYYKSGESYKMFMVDYYRAEVVLTDKKSYNKQIRTIKSDKLINKFAFGVLPENRYIFYVPSGTIKQNYNLDAR